MSVDIYFMRKLQELRRGLLHSSGELLLSYEKYGGVHPSSCFLTGGVDQVGPLIII